MRDATQTNSITQRFASAASALLALLSAALLRRRAQASANPTLVYNNRNDGPPDLDELWRDFNRKLSGLFGGKGGGGRNDDRPPGGPFQPDVKSASIGAILIGAVAVLFWLGSGFFIVQEGHRAVVTTFGKYSHTSDAGWQWRFPYPVQAHETVAVTQLQSVDVGRNSVVQATGLKDSSMLTQDENIVDIRFTVQYRRTDARAYLFENNRPDEAVVQAAESAVREIVGRNRVDQVLYEQRDAIAADLVKSIQAQLTRLKGRHRRRQRQHAERAGARAGAVGLQRRVQGRRRPRPFQERRPGLRQRRDPQGARHRQPPEGRGRGGYRSRVIAQADGDAQRFRSVLAEYQKAPAVTRDRLYLETMQQVYSNVTKVMIDSRAGSNLLYLPLDRLLQQSAAAASPASGGVTVVPTPAPVDPTGTQSVDIRSRDGARTRDREGR